MKNNKTEIFIVILLIGLIAINYYIKIFDQIETIFISISTFLFTIFSGFFISRQGSRYTNIRDKNATFDGKLSTIYRFSGHLDQETQSKIGNIIKNHYQRKLESMQWDYSLTHKTTTLTDIHHIIGKIGQNNLTNIQNVALGRISMALSGAQDVRKQLVALVDERIPKFQWILITLFMLTLLSAVSSIYSVGLLLPSILKAAFGVSIISVVIILHNLDILNLFEGIIGGHSAKDVIDIIDGKK